MGEKAPPCAGSWGEGRGRGARCKRLEGLSPPPPRQLASHGPPEPLSSVRSTYGKLWQESRRILKELLDQELSTEPRKPEKNRAVFWHRLATLFLRYVQVARRLEACYDQVVHPQKRLALRPLLDSVLGRILELKQQLVELDLSEYHYMDHVLEELKLTPVSQGPEGAVPPPHTHAPLFWNRAQTRPANARAALFARRGGRDACSPSRKWSGEPSTVPSTPPRRFPQPRDRCPLFKLSSFY